MRWLAGKVRSFIRRFLWIGDPTYIHIFSSFPGGKLIGQPKQLGQFSVIDYGGDVSFGENVLIGFGVVIVSVSTITGSSKEEVIKKPVVIGNNVEIGSHAVILPGVTIGDNSTIGAGAVVTESIPANSLAVGMPAKVVKHKDNLSQRN